MTQPPEELEKLRATWLNFHESDAAAPETVNFRTAFGALLVAAASGGDTTVALAKMDEVYAKAGSTELQPGTLGVSYRDIKMAFATMHQQHPELQLFEKVHYFGALRGSKVYRAALMAFVEMEGVSPSAAKSAHIRLGGILRRDGKEHSTNEAEVLLHGGADYFAKQYETTNDPNDAAEASTAEYDLSFVYHSRGDALKGDERTAQAAKEEMGKSLACLERAAEFDVKAGKPAKGQQTLTRKGVVQMEEGMVSPTEARDYFQERRRALKAHGGESSAGQEGVWYLNATGRQLEAVLRVGGEAEARELFDLIQVHPALQDWCGGSDAVDSWVDATEAAIAQLKSAE